MVSALLFRLQMHTHSGTDTQFFSASHVRQTPFLRYINTAGISAAFSTFTINLSLEYFLPEHAQRISPLHSHRCKTIRRHHPHHSQLTIMTSSTAASSPITINSMSPTTNHLPNSGIQTSYRPPIRVSPRHSTWLSSVSPSLRQEEERPHKRRMNQSKVRKKQPATREYDMWSPRDSYYPILSPYLAALCASLDDKNVMLIWFCNAFKCIYNFM